MAHTRKLLPTEGPLLADHFIRLNPDDRRLRFGGLFMHDDVLKRYAASLDWNHACHIGWFEGGVLRGMAQLTVASRTVDAGPPWLRPGAGEFGVSVEQPWRRLGVATQLIGQAIAVARNRHVRDLYLLCRRENEPMRRLARKLGFHLAYDEGEVLGHIALSAPDHDTALAEGAIEAAGTARQWTGRATPQAAG
jgi:GNAT superfamily N-acetyltransferase